MPSILLGLRWVSNFDSEVPHPDSQQIRAIAEMPSPTLQTLRSFLGLESYYSSFLPSLHEVRGLPKGVCEAEIHGTIRFASDLL
ncbi:unnamed protein product [Hymenolepis diminuta]|uniref:Reverse transcriptase n=1 Tax=Hymenolepis diminuta TaxID=6216 RepID=A0A158QFN9_HYMDI|nr:unnamed protein product [Hymenolepis diminuta]